MAKRRRKGFTNVNGFLVPKKRTGKFKSTIGRQKRQNARAVKAFTKQRAADRRRSGIDQRRAPRMPGSDLRKGGRGRGKRVYKRDSKGRFA